MSIGSGRIRKAVVCHYRYHALHLDLTAEVGREPTIEKSYIDASIANTVCHLSAQDRVSAAGTMQISAQYS